MPEPKFVRFVVWVGSRKRWYLAAYALAAAFIGIVAFALSGDAFPNKTPGFLTWPSIGGRRHRVWLVHAGAIHLAYARGLPGKYGVAAESKAERLGRELIPNSSFESRRSASAAQLRR